ncbi:hypothetical protein [Pseudonocardia sp. NPDC049154]|uniref:hypothetical protein n=1 Tax=Pseudonocardia sp. NPDC049154 TaxID=3155501 RepID=UPI00340233C7
MTNTSIEQAFVLIVTTERSVEIEIGLGFSDEDVDAAVASVVALTEVMQRVA